MLAVAHHLLQPRHSQDLFSTQSGFFTFQQFTYLSLTLEDITIVKLFILSVALYSKVQKTSLYNKQCILTFIVNIKVQLSKGYQTNLSD